MFVIYLNEHVLHLRPDLLDDALLRPGRFDKLVYIAISNQHDDRRQMFQALTQK
jgi:peroxin-6